MHVSLHAHRLEALRGTAVEGGTLLASVSEVLDVLFTRTWWRYTPGDGRWFTAWYHWGNILEGCAWVVFAALVLRRFLTHRNSRLELAYALVFATFAVSDFVEAWQQSSWLIWLKLVNLAGLLWLRHTVMTRFYPAAKVY